MYNFVHAAQRRDIAYTDAARKSYSWIEISGAAVNKTLLGNKAELGFDQVSQKSVREIHGQHKH